MLLCIAVHRRVCFCLGIIRICQYWKLSSFQAKSAEHTNMVCQVEIKQYASLFSQNIKPQATEVSVDVTVLMLLCVDF